ncbi:MAG: PocR ligand-binding domain-containing protein, partial [Candidatus Cloacimonetes bacterium]|nr:PocR ligand-binding domain-containing protein [Candidatus Cloacimonadota bacterium]
MVKDNSKVTVPVAIVVNDSQTKLIEISELLRKMGIAVQTYNGVEDAFNGMSRSNPPDLIVTYLYMSGIDGWRFCRLLRSPEYSEFNKVPILIVSAMFAGEETSSIATDLGANAFLSAPIDKKLFNENVRALLRGEQPINRLRVLVAGESESQATLLTKAFQTAGYLADTVFTADKAISSFEMSNYDVAVLDSYLPDENSDVLLKKFRQKNPDCVCVMITTDPNPESALKWMQSGAAAFLHKPFEPENLIEVCTKARREQALLRVADLLEERSREFRNSEYLNRTTINSLSEAVHIVDSNLCVVLYNQQFQQLCAKVGYIEDAIGRKVNEIFPFLPKEVMNQYHQVFETGIPITTQEENEIHGQQIITETKKIPLIEEGKTSGVITIIYDITELKLAQRQAQQRLAALTQPEIDFSTLSLTDIVDLKVLQKLQDDFAEALDMPSVIFDTNGAYLTKPSRFTKFCALVRSNKKGAANCHRYDCKLMQELQEDKKPTIRRGCLLKNLVTGTVPVVIQGQHLANWSIGQVIDSELDIDEIRNYAHEIDIDEDELIAAAKTLVPIDEEAFGRAIHFLDSLSGHVSLLALKNMQQGREIAERQQAEKVLKEERNLFSSGPVITIIWSPVHNGPVNYVSANCTEILGYTPAEMTNPSFLYASLIHPDDLKRLGREVAYHMENHNATFEQSYRLRLKNGEYRWFYDFTKFVWDGDTLIEIRGYIFDQSDLKSLETNLQDERSRLMNIIKGTNIGTWEWNVQTGDIIFNERWAEMLGYTIKELLPVSIETWNNLCHKGDLQRSNKLLKNHFEGKTQFYGSEFRMKHRNGNWIWVLDSGQVMSWDDDGKPLLMFGTQTDITERKQAEQEHADHLRFHENLDRVDNVIQKSIDMEQMMSDVLQMILEIFEADRSWLLYPCDPDTETWNVPMERTRPEYPGVLANGKDVPLLPDFAEEMRKV